ncbi:hypothetical protein [Pontimicrobium aquaticum]|uniref:Uncharacterized protein n=1 Tax=Pontimicrobium aquaticum TaxID=2565367 RepID=A0A4U0EZY7_9FLAO|nr:hypothetical protein [Pontimicrobium aquaticum]TJY37711.1 hypothetical protein E5167_00200 [Pontimicrobium aquaticum]
MTSNELLLEGLLKTKDELNIIRDRLDVTIKNILVVIQENDIAKNYSKITNPEKIKEIKIKNLFNESEAVKNFPSLARKDKQLLWLFENYLGRGTKLHDVQYHMNMLSGSVKRIDNVARRLKKQGKLVVVKYNGANNLSFWGLPEWVLSNDFKHEYKPKEKYLPIDINKKEVVRK